MPTLFLSYNRDDREQAIALEAALAAIGVSVLREPGERYGTPGWPQYIGEAIAEHDHFLLLWSKNAAISHIVEFEWNLAMLLSRHLIVLALDDQPLRQPLQPHRTIRSSDVHAAIAEVMDALQAALPPRDEAQIREVVKKLVRFNETKPAQVTRKMRIVYFDSRVENPLARF